MTSELLNNLESLDVALNNSWLIPKLIQFLGYKDSIQMLLWNKSWNTLNDQELYWRALCRTTSQQFRLYLPTEAHFIESWKPFFVAMYTNRILWDAPLLANPEEDELQLEYEERTFNLKVCARFRPKVDTAGGVEDDEDLLESNKTIVLPLHQRVALVMADNPGISKKDAMSLLFSKNEKSSANPWDGAVVKFKSTSISGNPAVGGGGSTDIIDDTTAENDYKENIEKMNEVDVSLVGNYRASIISVNSKQGKILTCAPVLGLKEFHFDAVFSEKDNQSDVYQHSAAEAIVDVINGSNASIIVFGQTGSGKTYTMFGEHIIDGLDPYTFEIGIVPRACEDMLNVLEERKKAYGFDYSVGVSFVEVFGEEAISNLLDGGKPLGPSVVAGHRYVLDGKGAVPVSTQKDILECIKIGNTQRRSAATAMNDRSSRAHSVFICDVNQTDPETNKSIQSRLFMVDLGGSEQLKQSKATGQRLVEAVNINKGLLALKSCIDALNAKNVHVPFKNSRLTMLLSEVLGGDSKTTIIVTGAPEQRHAVQTIKTLQFGETCQAVENRATTNFDSLTHVIKELNDEIRNMEGIISKMEIWTTKKIKRIDTHDGAEEILTVSELTGAEKENKILSDLLARRRALLGNVDLKIENTNSVYGVKSIQAEIKPLTEAGRIEA